MAIHQCAPGSLALGNPGRRWRHDPCSADSNSVRYVVVRNIAACAMLGRLSVRSGDREMGSKHLTKKQLQNNAGKAKKAKKRADAKEPQGTVAPGASSPMLPPTIRFNVLCAASSTTSEPATPLATAPEGTSRSHLLDCGYVWSWTVLHVSGVPPLDHRLAAS